MKKALFKIKSLNKKGLLLGFALALLFMMVFTACQDELDDKTIQQVEIPDQLMYKNNGEGLQRFDARVIKSWYKQMLDLAIETPGHTPPILARSFGNTGGYGLRIS